VELKTKLAERTTWKTRSYPPNYQNGLFQGGRKKRSILHNLSQSYFMVSCFERVGKGNRQHSAGAKAKRFVNDTKTTEESSKEPNKTSKPQPQCPFCKRTNCVKFKAQKRENKVNFVKGKGLCFGCQRKGQCLVIVRTG